MTVSWRGPGDPMATVDLRRFDDDQLVIHYGGALGSVNAYTFANSLVAFSDTIIAVNNAINPGQNIEIRVEALAQGSFRAVVRKIKKGLPGLLGRQIETAVGALVALVIIQPMLPSSDPETVTQVFADRVEIRKGGDLIIVSKEVFEKYPAVQRDPEVQRNLRKTFETIEGDDAIENFGVTPEVNDKEPEVQIPRDDFGRLTSPPSLVAVDETRRREQRVKARLIILKAWLTPGKRKWSFEWNGVPISAYIIDPDFLDRLANHDQLIGNGDAIDATLFYYQDFDESLGVFVNDQHSFVVEEVIRYLPRGGAQGRLV